MEIEHYLKLDSDTVNSINTLHDMYVDGLISKYEYNGEAMKYIAEEFENKPFKFVAVCKK